MSELELIYFPIHGRALMARMLIKIAGIDCKDTVVSFEEFGKMKSGNAFIDYEIDTPLMDTLLFLTNRIN